MSRAFVDPDAMTSLRLKVVSLAGSRINGARWAYTGYARFAVQALGQLRWLNGGQSWSWRAVPPASLSRSARNRIKKPNVPARAKKAQYIFIAVSFETAQARNRKLRAYSKILPHGLIEIAARDPIRRLRDESVRCRIDLL
jgi:hypothetical protein